MPMLTEEEMAAAVEKLRAASEPWEEYVAEMRALFDRLGEWFAAAFPGMFPGPRPDPRTRRERLREARRRARAVTAARGRRHRS